MAKKLNATEAPVKQTLFSISSDLESIFDEIEENGGEITDDLNKRLEIASDNLQTKLASYVSAIRLLKNRVDECKTEKGRIDKIRKREENRINFLNSAIGEAVMRYGDTNKSGNKFIEIGLSKITARPSKKIVIDEKFINTIISLVTDFFSSCEDIDDLYNDPKQMFISLLEFINSNEDIKEYGEITMQDLETIPCSISVSCNSIARAAYEYSLMSFIKDGTGVIKSECSITSASTLIEGGYDVRYASGTNDINVLIK